MVCFHELNLVCCISGGPCIGKEACADYISKSEGEAKVKSGLKYSIAEKQFKGQKRTLRENL